MKASFGRSRMELVARFDAVVSRHPELVQRKTFGNPAAYVTGNMATGLFADGWFVRLSEAEAQELLGLPGAMPFSPMPGRPMKGYVMLPSDVIADDETLEPWLVRSIAHAAALPPK